MKVYSFCKSQLAVTRNMSSCPASYSTFMTNARPLAQQSINVTNTTVTKTMTLSHTVDKGPFQLSYDLKVCIPESSEYIVPTLQVTHASMLQDAQIAYAFCCVKIVQSSTI